MTRRRTTLSHRILALGLLVTLVLFAYTAIVQPLLGAYARYDSTLSDAALRLEKYRALTAGQASLKGELKAHRQSQLSEEFYLSGDTAALAAAALQDHLQRLVQSAGGHLISTNPLSAKQTAGLMKVSVSARMTLGSNGLPEFLYRLETGKPLVFIDSLHVHGQTWYGLLKHLRHGRPSFTVQVEVSAYTHALHLPTGASL